ncbi:MAG TPA: heavy metal-binding domain-containing protein [Gammaproteobacteria bacterium]|nr:heavy metal-binding domain-containing protein [Gammaproteobacteria bacterium]
MADLISFLVLLALGYGFGQYFERRHYRSIRRREKELQDILILQSKILPATLQNHHEQFLVNGNVVISVDYFKRFVAGLRNLVGGRVTSYETLIDRARREAILRMKEEALASGAKMILNVKYEMCSIYKGRGRQIGSVEALAYGTAFNPTPATPATAPGGAEHGA